MPAQRVPQVPYGSTAVVRGPQGPAGSPGADGAPGPGVPAGGATGRVLAKTSATDYATAWTDLSGTYARKGRKVVSVYDEFTAVADGALSGRTPLRGNAWQVTGATPPAITSGLATSTGTGYMWQNLGTAPGAIACETVWLTSGTNATQTMAFTGGTSTIDLNNLAAHFNYGPTRYTVTVRKDGGTFDTILFGVWRRPCRQDGVTPYTFGMFLRDDTLAIVGPNGEVHAISDPRVRQILGTVVFWEPGGASPQSGLRSVSAVPEVTTGEPNGADITDVLVGYGLSQTSGDGTSGGRDTACMVSMGEQNVNQLPTITFGPGVIYTKLTSSAAAAAVSINTDRWIPNGSTIQLESGTNTETVTASANSTGTGPYATTVSALTKTHPAESAAQVTVPASFRTTIYSNNGSLNLPASIFQASVGFYFAGQTAQIFQPSAGVIQFTGLGAGKGVVRVPALTTGNRPAAATVGAGSHMFDTTLGKPIWSDGTNWKDATGTTV